MGVDRNGWTRVQAVAVMHSARVQLRFAAMVLMVSLGLLGPFAATAPAPSTWLAWLYLVSVGGYFGTLLFVAALLLLPARWTRFSSWLVPVAAWIWLLVVVVDFATFRLYGFHLNLLVVEMFITDPAGVGVPTILLVLAGVLAVVLAVLVGWLDRLARAGARLRGVVVAFGALVLPAFLANSVIHAWAQGYHRDEITQVDSLFPLYYPITSRAGGQRLSAWWPSVFPPGSGTAIEAAGHLAGALQYPARPLTFGSPTVTPSILMIVVESWQADSLRPEIMPNLWHLAGTATRFEQHLSGGAATVPGLFSLLFGLHASYYDRFKDTPGSNPSLLTETLYRRGYRSRVFTSSFLERFALRSLLFPRVAAPDYHFDPDDRTVLDQYLASTGSDTDQSAPRFDFIFLTSSHSPYSYPPGYARFLPLPAVEGGFAINQSVDAAPYRNDYHNSLYYVDALLGELVADLERRGRLDSSWIVITGDHAEEFNENGLGHWGHGSNFSRWQTQTPLIVRLPGQTAGRVERRLSLHQDVVPTLLEEALGCTSPAADFANGVNLFRLPDQRGTVFASYFTKAYLIDGVVMEGFSGRKYAWNDMQQTRPAADAKRIKEVMDQERQFLR